VILIYQYRRTDGQTDGQTDVQTIMQSQYRALHYSASRDKNLKNLSKTYKIMACAISAVLNGEKNNEKRGLFDRIWELLRYILHTCYVHPSGGADLVYGCPYTVHFRSV